MNEKNILLVEDDTALIRIMELEFGHEGYSFDIAKDGQKALDLFAAGTYEVIILDLMLPVISGIEVCRKIRRNSNVPIIMVTAKREVSDSVIGLDMGADDYLTKPFEMEELLARIRSAFRRTKMDKAELSKIIVGDLSINMLSREVLMQETAIELTKKEYELLEYLVKNKGIVLTRDQIISEVWGYDFVGDTNVLDVYIKYLRDKLDYPFNTKLIHTVRGVGYSLKEQSGDEN